MMFFVLGFLCIFSLVSSLDAAWLLARQEIYVNNNSFEAFETLTKERCGLWNPTLLSINIVARTPRDGREGFCTDNTSPKYIFDAKKMPRIPKPWSMEFHATKHGRFIKLSKNNTNAIREGDTYDHGVVFSSRPIHIGEIFQLNIDQIESKWAGSLRLGVTVKNPHCPHTGVVRAVTDLFVEDCKDYWVLSGSRIHNGTQEKEYNINVHSLKVNDKIGLQVTANGELLYYVNGVCKGTAITGIPTKKELYALFDVYGRTKEVTWRYFGVNSLENLCKEQILKSMQSTSEQNLNELPLPKIIIEFLRH